MKETIIIDINESIKSHTIYLRTKYNLKLPDAIVAATARFLQIPLLTADRDFKKIIEIPILFYEK
ncbi:MAG: PIN domain-containing protein [Candidatus Marinimicrobia bacterium]|nr:PIN domain-containing protein [Candidatus Neomarinimicrobiota bacterium]